MIRSSFQLGHFIYHLLRMQCVGLHRFQPEEATIYEKKPNKKT